MNLWLAEPAHLSLQSHWVLTDCLFNRVISHTIGIMQVPL